MAKKSNPEDLLEQLRGLLSPAAAAPKTNNRKVVTQLRKAANAIEAAIGLLTGGTEEEAPESEEVAEVDAEAPYGRKKDGTPKSRPGRVKAE